MAINKKWCATTKRDDIEYKYIVTRQTKEEAEKRIFEISREHLKVKEVQDKEDT